MIDELDFSKPVGDPMVEIGRQGLVEFCKKEQFANFEELKKAIERLFNIYVFKTSGRIGQIFSSNSKFTHNSTSNNLNERLRQAMELYETLMGESKSGYCLACGEKDNLCSVNKTILPLTTGNSNVNFTSNFSSQFLVCKKCMTSLFFAPSNMQKVAGRMAFLISNNNDINRYWSKQNIKDFNINTMKQADSLVDSKTNIFENFIYETMYFLQKKRLFGDITFYLISNVDKGSDIEIIHVGENQIRFIYEVAPKFFADELPEDDKNEWNSLIWKYSSVDKNNKYRTLKESINDKKVVIKFEKEVVENKNFQAVTKYFNPLISSFVQGKSLLRFFAKNRSSWHLTEIYLKEIRGMREERLKVLKSIADKLQALNDGDKDFLKKVILPIEKTKSQSELREKLRVLMRRFLLKTEKPLYTVDDMVFEILPSGESWQETKDILLIALYEKLTLDEELREILENDITDEGEDLDEQL
jgi:CRISPR-associated protein Cst1